VYAYGPRRRRVPWFLIVALAVLAGVVIVLLVLFATGSLGGIGRPFYGEWGGFLLLFLLLWICFFAIRVAFWSQRVRNGGRGGAYRGPDPAVMIARRRYARGEITRQQYDQIVADLQRPRPPP
jgi:uncharacterized membrane protein